MPTYPEPAKPLVDGGSAGDSEARLIADLEKLLPEVLSWRR